MNDLNNITNLLENVAYDNDYDEQNGNINNEELFQEFIRWSNLSYNNAFILINLAIIVYLIFGVIQVFLLINAYKFIKILFLVHFIITITILIIVFFFRFKDVVNKLILISFMNILLIFIFLMIVIVVFPSAFKNLFVKNFYLQSGFLVVLYILGRLNSHLIKSIVIVMYVSIIFFSYFTNVKVNLINESRDFKHEISYYNYLIYQKNNIMDGIDFYSFEIKNKTLTNTSNNINSKEIMEFLKEYESNEFNSSDVQNNIYKNMRNKKSINILSHLFSEKMIPNTSSGFIEYLTRGNIMTYEYDYLIYSVELFHTLSFIGFFYLGDMFFKNKKKDYIKILKEKKVSDFLENLINNLPIILLSTSKDKTFYFNNQFNSEHKKFYNALMKDKSETQTHHSKSLDDGFEHHINITKQHKWLESLKNFNEKIYDDELNINKNDISKEIKIDTKDNEICENYINQNNYFLDGFLKQSYNESNKEISLIDIISYVDEKINELFKFNSNIKIELFNLESYIQHILLQEFNSFFDFNLKNSEHETLKINHDISYEEAYIKNQNSKLTMKKNIENHKDKDKNLTNSFVNLGKFKYNNDDLIYNISVKVIVKFIGNEKEIVYTFMINNITEVITMEKKVSELLIQKKLLSKMAHEFKTPLLVIRSLVNSINDKNISNKEIISQINSISEYINFLINDISISSSRHGLISISKKMINVKSIMEYFLTTSRSLTNVLPGSKSNIKISMEYDSKIDKYFLYTDEFRLKQVLFNLLNNSLKFTQKGSITLITEIVIKNSEEILQIRIKDTGIGIKNSHLKTIIKGNKNSSSNVIINKEDYNKSGTGLGLNIVSILLNKLKIKFDINSNLGIGTEVILEFRKNSLFLKNYESSKILDINFKLDDIDHIHSKSICYEKFNDFNLKVFDDSHFIVPCHNSNIIDNINNQNSNSNLNEDLNSTKLIEKYECFNKFPNRELNFINNESIHIVNFSMNPITNETNLSNINMENYRIHNNRRFSEIWNENLFIKETFFFELTKCDQYKLNVSNKTLSVETLENDINVNFPKSKRNIEFIFRYDFIDNCQLIIILEDNHLIRKSLVNQIIKLPEFIKHENLFLIEAADGVDLLKIATDLQKTNYKIKCLITDENMEFMNGSDCIKIIRKMMNEGIISKFSLLSLTAFSDDDRIDSIKKSGADFVFSKPISKSNLSKIFNNYILN